MWNFSSRKWHFYLQSLNSWRSRGWTNSGLTVSNHQNNSAMNTIMLCCTKSTEDILKCVNRLINNSMSLETNKSYFYLLETNAVLVPWAPVGSRACPLSSGRNFCSGTHWQTLWVTGCCTGYQRWMELPSNKYLIKQKRSVRDTAQWPEGYKCHTNWTGAVVLKIVTHVDIRVNAWNHSIPSSFMRFGQ